MRRKLFMFAVILLITVFLLTEAFPDLWVPDAVIEDQGSEIHTGTVRELREKEDKWILDIDDDRGFRVRLSYYGEISSPWELSGSEIAYRTSLRSPDPARNPHCFDYRKYLRSERVWLKGTIRSWEITKVREDLISGYLRALCRLKYGFREILPKDDRGLIMGMVFGETGELSEDVYEDFKRNGTAHILAVSGLHIGILYSIYEKLSGGRMDRGRLVLLGFLLYSYGALTCWRPSVVRAEIMIGLKAIARTHGLRYDSLTAMSLAAVILILRCPYVIYGTGFQMSFLAIMAINIVMKVIPKKIPDTIAQTLAVNVTLMLYQAYVFNYISPLSVLINIPVLYLAGISIPLSFGTFMAYGMYGVIGTSGSVGASEVMGAAGALGSAASGGGSGILDILIVPAVSVSKLLTAANSVMSFNGHSAMDVISPPQGVMIFVIAAMLFGCSELADLIRIRKERKYFIRCFIVIAIAALVVNIICSEPITHDQIIFVDVGQGACTHISTGSLDVMIDGGGSHDRNVGEKTLKSYLLKNGARDLDLALATHEDTDHYKGLEELSECYEVKDLKIWSVAGDKVKLSDDIVIETLWPLEAPVGVGSPPTGQRSHEEGYSISGAAPGAGSTVNQAASGSRRTVDQAAGSDNKQGNDESSVFMIHYHGVRVLITGDLGEDGEKEMLRFYEGQGKLKKLKADVLNVGHHGSKYSSCDEFLDAVRPKFAIIQVGRNNYGHPSLETLERLAAHGARVLRNDQAGAVGLRIGRSGLKAIHVMIG